MTSKAIPGPYIFEPHNGFGGKDPDGEPWPFGYISTEFPSPIFQLEPIHTEDPEALYETALVLAASWDLLDALKTYDAAFTDFDPDNRDSRHQMRLAVIKARAAIAKAAGQ